MKINLINEPRIIVSNPYSNFNYFAWPSVARLQNGRIAVASSGFRYEHICPFGKATISFSEDDGETFSPPMPVIDTVLDDRDAGLCTFGENGLIVTSFNDTVEGQRICADKGHTMGARRDTVHAYLNTVKPEDEAKYLGTLYRVSYDCGKSFGELFHAPVSSPHGPIQLQDGSILWVGRAGNTAGEDIEYEHAEQIQAYKIGLNGKCEFVGVIPDIPNLDSWEPYAIELPDGKLICHIRVGPTFGTWQSESLDGGKTWTKPHEVLPENEGAPVHLIRHSSGMLIGVYSHRGFKGIPPYGIRVMFSKDEGTSWDYGNIIFEHKDTRPGPAAGQDIGYPATVELKDGSLLTVFYAHPDCTIDPSSSTNPSVIYAQKWTFEE